jgi:hypothetical protein
MTDSLSARPVLRHVYEVECELVAGACRLKAVLVICEVEAPIMDDREIEVVREHLTEEDHPVDALWRHPRWVGRISNLSALTAPALMKPGTIVVLLEPLANPRESLDREYAR